VAAGMRRSATWQKKTQKERLSVEKCAGYLLKNKAYLQIVKLRSIRSSGDFERYWQFHEDQEFVRNHQSHYPDLSLLDKCLKFG
jgi:hypothetical protein